MIAPKSICLACHPSSPTGRLFRLITEEVIVFSSFVQLAFITSGKISLMLMFLKQCV